MSCQRAVATFLAVAMGDAKAVAIAQEVHVDILERGQALLPLLEYGHGVPQAMAMAGIVVDDLGILAVGKGDSCISAANHHLERAVVAY